MGAIEWRGGFPAVFRGASLGTTPVEIHFGSHLRKLDPEAQDGRYSPGAIKWLVIQNHDTTNPIRLYFFESHATAGEHYVQIAPAGVNGGNRWEGPVEAERCWVAAGAGTIASYDLTGFMRRP